MESDMKMAKTATLDDLKSWEPCWVGDREDAQRDIAALAGRRKRWSWRHVVALLGADGLGDSDWLWLATRFLSHCGLDDVNRLAAAQIASDALRDEKKAGRMPHADLYAAIRVARRYARGKATDDELSAACSAARSAARRRSCKTLIRVAKKEGVWPRTRIKETIGECVA